MNRMAVSIAAGVVLLTSIPASAEGILNIYSWGDLWSPEMIKKFEEQYDVKVTFSEYDSSDTALAKLKAGGNDFDMIVAASTYIPIFIQEGLLLKSEPNKLENFKNVNKRWIDVSFDRGREYSIPWEWSTVGLSVNTSIYKGDINTAALLFDPPAELQGKINIIPEMMDVMGLAIHYLGGDKICTDDKALLQKVRDKLLEAKKHWISMDYNTIDPMVKGDFAVTSDWGGPAFIKRQRNPDIAYGYPQTGYGLAMDNLAILADAKNIDNAKLFMNFMMDPQNAAMLSNYIKYPNGIDGSEQYMDKEMTTSPEFVVPENLAGPSYWNETCSPEIQQIYGRIWTELKM
ncbi:MULTISPECIES: extracellular solute-binding protein [unclassified Ensifer]|uniref:Putrescine-binding periplasmic protein n=2 Tax=Brucella/Ochrobactrum group TaxID=2826938 RepID=A0A075XFH9_9HYPH|nr:ABC transporter periplasmic spermidine putrescine-binding protein potd [Ochrobactrum sp. SJY1]